MKTKQYKILGVLLTGLFFSMGLMGCGSVSSLTGSSTSSNSSPSITYISFSISPEKTKYTAGESFTVTMTRDGDKDDVEIQVASSSYSGSFSQFAQKATATTVTGKASNSSGGKITLQLGPSYTQSINGVETIQVSGNATYVIETE